MTARARIVGFDVARAFAVLGMVLVNFKVVMGAGDAGPAWLQALAGFVEGKAAATFVVLAGVGISLLTRRAREGGDVAERRVARRKVLARALFLLVVGLVYTPVWPGDILHFYGVYLAVAALVLFWPGRALWAGAVVANVVFCALLVTLDYERGWNWETLHYADFWTAAGMVRHLLFNGFHPVFPWVAFLLVGMWLGRRDLVGRARRQRLLWAGLAALVGGSLLSAWLVRSLGDSAALGPGDAEALFGTGPMPPNPLYVLVGLGAALVVIALSLELEARFAGRAWLDALVAAGQLSLTLYVAHVLLGMGLLGALGRLEGQSLAFSVVTAVGFTLAGVLFSWAWRRKFRRGPLEAVMRRLTG